MFLPWKAIQVNFGQNLWTPCLWPRFCCWRFVWRFMKCSIFDWKPSKLSNFNQSKRTCHCKGTTGPSFNSSHHNIGMIRAKIRSCAHAIVVHKLSHSSPPTDDDPSDWWGRKVMRTIWSMYIHLDKSEMIKKMTHRQPLWITQISTLQISSNVLAGIGCRTVAEQLDDKY